MANIKDDPKVQDLLSKEAAKAEKALEKAVKIAIKDAADAAKDVLDVLLEAAKAEEEDPVVAKALKRHLREAKKAVLAAIKG